MTTRTGKTETKKAGKKDAKNLGEGREVLYPEFKPKTYAGKNALKAEEAKKLLDWRVVMQKGAGQFVDMEGREVVCDNNVRNRPLHWPTTLERMQDILTKNFRLNGEAMSIGKTGLILSAQKRLIALVLADQVRNGRQKERWDEVWGEGVPVSIECLISFGVEETPEVIRTIDNVQPRTLQDVLFTEAKVFGKANEADKKVLFRMIDHGIKVLWDRAGAVMDAYVPRKTHTQALEWLDAHPTLKEACVLLHTLYSRGNEGKGVEEYGQGAGWVSNCEQLPPGNALALFYLMAASATDGADYHQARREGEAKEKGLIKWGNWDLAVRFWSLMTGKDNPKGGIAPAVRTALANLRKDGFNARTPEKAAVLVNAWLEFIADGGKEVGIRPDNIFPELEVSDSTGNRFLKSVPLVGGIDLGPFDAHMKKERQKEVEGLESKPEENGHKAGNEEVQKEQKRKARDKRVQEADAGLNGDDAADEEALAETADEDGEQREEDVTNDDPPAYDPDGELGEGEDVPDGGEEDIEAPPPKKVKAKKVKTAKKAVDEASE